MLAGTKIKGNQDNQPRTSFTNSIDSDLDQFFAASLQFLHRLLAERITLQCAKLDANGVPRSQLQVEDMREHGNNTARKLYVQKIDQIEEYETQLCSVENCLSNIQLDAAKSMRNTADCDAIISNETNDVGLSEDPRNFKSTKLHDDSYDFLGQNLLYLLDSTHPYSFSKCDELSADFCKRAEINVSGMEGPAAASLTIRKTASDATTDFTEHLQTHPIIPTWTSVKNRGIQSSASYADIVRKAVSGLVRNCGKKRRSRRKKDPANSWLPEAGIAEFPKEENHQRGCQSEVEFEISSESQVGDGLGSDILKEIPLRVQLMMETNASPRKPVTLLVRVSSTVFNLLNRKISNRDTKSSSMDPSTKTRTEPSDKKKRITSVFRNLLKGSRTPSSTIVYSAKEQLPSRMTFALVETVNDAGIKGDDTTLIYTPQKSASRDSLERNRNVELSCEAINEPTEEPRNTERASLKCMLLPPAKSVNDYEKILNLNQRAMSYQTEPWNGKSAESARQKLANDKALRTEAPSNKTEIMKGLTNYRDEKIIPFHCSDDSSQLGDERGGISQRDVDMFLKLVAEMRKTQTCQNANSKYVEIPVEIKTTETLLRLHKTENVFANFLDHRAREMEVGTLPGGAYLPQTRYSKSQDLPSLLDSLANGPQDNFQLLKNSEDSALEVLLRHITTGTSITSCNKAYEAERDTTVQTPPKRQLSKISVCYSSDSLSGSEHETPEVKLADSTVSRHEYRAHSHVSHVLSHKPRKLDNQRYFHHYEATEQNYTDSSENDKVVIRDKNEDRYSDSVMIPYSMGSSKVTKNEKSNLDLSSCSIQFRGKLVPCSRTEVIIEEQNYDMTEAGVKAQIVMGSEGTSLSIQETEKTVFCRPVLSKQICGDRKELADAMIRWWGPQINYSTTPSNQTQLSAYSVSINNLV